MVSDAFSDSVLSQELCNYPSFDKGIHPQDRLGFQEESSTEATTWMWAASVHGDWMGRWGPERPSGWMIPQSLTLFNDTMVPPTVNLHMLS